MAHFDRRFFAKRDSTAAEMKRLIERRGSTLPADFATAKTARGALALIPMNIKNPTANGLTAYEKLEGAPAAASAAVQSAPEPTAEEEAERAAARCRARLFIIVTLPRDQYLANGGDHQLNK